MHYSVVFTDAMKGLVLSSRKNVSIPSSDSLLSCVGFSCKLYCIPELILKSRTREFRHCS